MQQQTTKILYIITQGEWGGAQRYVFDLATHLNAEFDITIAAGEPAGRLDLQKKLEIGNWKLEILRLKHMVREISPINDILAIFELAKLYKTLKPDIVHLNSSKAGIIGSFARLMIYDLRFKMIYTVHGWVFNEPLGPIKKTLYCWLEKFTARWKDRIIVLSDKDFADGVELGIDKKKLVNIPLGIEIPKFLDKAEAREQMADIFNKRDSSASFHFGRNDTAIGTIANLYRTKGLDVLIEAVSLLVNDDNKTMRFVVIGEGPERKKLENLIKKYQLEQVIHLVGAIDNAAQYLKAFDLFVLPSRKEGTPYTIFEAMAAQIPIIATKVGGIPELLNKREELLVESEKPKQLAEKIIYLIRNLDEAKKNAQLSQNNRGLDKMLDKTKSIYSDYQEKPCL